jgi:hypothetical protein
MLTAGDWYKALDGLAPFDLAEDWDNVGLLVGSRQMPAQRVLLGAGHHPRCIGGSPPDGQAIDYQPPSGYFQAD